MATKKATAAPKTETKKAAKKVTVVENNNIDYKAENVGFKAGDVYQALAGAATGLTVSEIAKAANISEEETLLGMGWLLKEGKITAIEDKIQLI